MQDHRSNQKESITHTHTHTHKQKDWISLQYRPSSQFIDIAGVSWVIAALLESGIAMHAQVKNKRLQRLNTTQSNNKQRMPKFRLHSYPKPRYN